MLFEIFVKSPDQKILSLFSMNPGKSYYGREISRKLRLSLGTTHASLVKLESVGLLRFQGAGNTKLYSLDVDNPVITSYKILNTLLMLDPLVESLRDLARRIILFGSYATGTFTAESDLDIFIVSERKNNMAEIIDQYQRKSGLDIRPLLKSQVEWMKLEKASPEFFDELNHGIILWEKPIDEFGF